MDKRVILAVAGSGKTTHIVNTLSLDARFLLLTYTDNNLKNLRRKIIGRFGYFPDNISLHSYFTFLYAYCFKPFLWRKLGAKGIRWDTPAAWTLKLPRDNSLFYLDKQKRVYHNRIAKLLEVENLLEPVNQRIEKYFDNVLIDEVQDLAGHDFNLLASIAKASVDMVLVGDFFQHTFDTSRDGNVNKSLHYDLDSYTKRLSEMGLEVDANTLSSSYRCSPTICSFVSEKLGIAMDSHRYDSTAIHVVEKQNEVEQIVKCGDTIKLFYREHYKHPCYSKNWGDSKGEDHYEDVCVVLNKNTLKLFQKDELNKLKPQTRNKLYVACTRARNDLYFVAESCLERN